MATPRRTVRPSASVHRAVSVYVCQLKPSVRRATSSSSTAATPTRSASQGASAAATSPASTTDPIGDALSGKVLAQLEQSCATLAGVVARVGAEDLGVLV